MTGQAVALAVSAGFLLASAAVSLFCLWRAGALIKAQSSKPSVQGALGAVQQKLEALERELQEARRQGSSSAVVPAPPRAGFNLEKRTHALRMHRRGEPPAQIAAVLELPVQEVELLLKVHRIVLRNI